MNTWRKMALNAAAVTLVGGALFAGVAYAQTPTATPVQTEEQAQEPTEQAEGGWFGYRFFGGDGGMMGRFGGRGLGRGHFGGPGGMRGMGGPGGMHGMGGPLQEERLAIAATALDMTTDELQAALEEGQTLNEIAEAQGLDETEFTTALQEAAIAWINQAVADGELTESQAEDLKARVEDGMPFFGGPRGERFGGFGRGFGSGPLAEIIGDPQELLAEATGMSVAELQSALTTTIEERLDAAVEAGDLTQSQADQLKERLAEGLPFFGGRN